MKDGVRPVRGHAAQGEEHDRLWGKWREMDPEGGLDGYATRRPSGTAVVVLEPRTEATP